MFHWPHKAPRPSAAPTRRRCGLAFGLLCATSAILAAPARADVESPWLAREGHLVIVRRVPDVLRGFDQVAVETWRAQPDGSWRTVSTWEPLASGERGWYVARGELELFRRDLAGRLEGYRAGLARDGWEPLTPLAVLVPQACEMGECAPAALSAGELRLSEVRLAASVESTEVGSRIVLTETESGAVAQLGHITPASVALGSGRSVRLDLARLGAAGLTPDGGWVVFSVDTVVPIHAELAPGRFVFAVSAEMLSAALGLDAGAWLPDGAT